MYMYIRICICVCICMYAYATLSALLVYTRERKVMHISRS